MDTTELPGTLCPRHGAIDNVIDGRCVRCVREEILRELSELARQETPLPAAHERPVALMPELDIWPRDLSWLAGGAIPPARALAFRRLFMTTYLDAARQMIATRRPVRALMMLGGAMNFACADPVRLGSIHLETSRALLALLAGRGDLERSAIGEKSLRMLASGLAHLEVALRHFEDAETASLDHAEHHALVTVARYTRDEIQRRHSLSVQGDLIVGPPPLGAMSLRELLFPSVPVRPEE